VFCNETHKTVLRITGYVDLVHYPDLDKVHKPSESVMHHRQNLSLHLLSKLYAPADGACPCVVSLLLPSSDSPIGRTVRVTRCSCQRINTDVIATISCIENRTNIDVISEL
jgi:hypothetical protein